MKTTAFLKYPVPASSAQKQLDKKILILKTNIQTPEQVEEMGSVFHNHSFVVDWSIDTEDVDCVLRIEAFAPLTETQVIEMVEDQGFYCDVLPD